jgi:hypothetical protein
MIELKPHQRFNQCTLSISLLTHHNDSRCAYRVSKLLRKGLQLIVGVIKGLGSFLPRHAEHEKNSREQGRHPLLDGAGGLPTTCRHPRSKL